MITASIAITIKIPTPIPAWKISPINSQLVKVVRIKNRKLSLSAVDFMIFGLLVIDIVNFRK